MIALRRSAPAHLLLALLAAAGPATACRPGGRAPQPATPPPAARSEACRPARAHPAGRSAVRLASEPGERTYLLHVPASYDGRTPLPVVLDLHGSGVSPEVELAISGLDRASERRGFVVVLPVGGARLADGRITWNVPRDPSAPDDVAFVAQVLDAVEERLCVDAARVYATGFSGGARMASELACALPERLAAIGAVAGIRPPAGRRANVARSGRCRCWRSTARRTR